MITIQLSDREAFILWSIVDGARDAGSCQDGMTEEEINACEKFIRPISKRMLRDKSFGEPS